MSNKEVSIKGKRVEHEGFVFQYDGKWRDGKLKVYRIHGDINQTALISDALELEAAAFALGQM